MTGLNAKSKDDGARSAIIFTRELIHKLESPELHLPTTYIGVKQVRPAGGRQTEVGEKRKRCASETSDICDADNHRSPNTGSDTRTDRDAAEGADEITLYPVTFKVTNPDGTERRMTAQEKKQLKKEMKQAKQLARKAQKQIEVKERIRVDKEKKQERKRQKWLAKQKKLHNEHNSEESEHEGNQQQGTNADNTTLAELQSNTPSSENAEEETDRKYRGSPPVVLTPAATRVAIDLGVISSKTTEDVVCSTVLDDDLAREWACQIQVSMVPAEQHRAKEAIRQMPYKLTPEVWKRLRPIETQRTHAAAVAAADTTLPITKWYEPRVHYSMTTLRNRLPSYDDAAYFIFKHLHQHFNLHLACGARFGCDYLLYDGRRDEKHSFAGLRIYNATNNDSNALPLPSVYDMHGFVRSMNTARKLALVATVTNSKDNPHIAQIAIVDMALEAILTAETHIKKGNTEKRRCVNDTSELMKRKN